MTSHNVAARGIRYPTPLFMKKECPGNIIVQGSIAMAASETSISFTAGCSGGGDSECETTPLSFVCLRLH